MKTGKRLKYAFLGFIISAISYSQNTRKVDSLLQQLSTLKQDTNKAIVLNELGSIYFNQDLAKAKESIEQALALSKKINYLNGEGKAISSLGSILQKNGNYDSAIVLHQQVIKIYSKIKNIKGIARAYSDICISHWRKADYVKALDFQFKSLKLYEQLGDQKEIGYSYNMIGIIYKDLKQIDNSISYYLKSVDIRKKVNDEKGIASTYNNIGNIYKSKIMEDSAMKYYDLALILHKKFNNKTSESMVVSNIGTLKFTLGKYAEAKKYYMLSAEIERDVLDSNSLATSYINIGNACAGLKDYKNAELNIQKGLDILRRIGDKEGVMSAYEMLAYVFQEGNNYEKALEYYQMYAEQKDSIIGLKEKTQISEMQTKYDVEKKDLLLDAQKKQLEKEKIQRYLIISALTFFIILFSIAIWAFIQKRKNSRLLESKNNLLENANHEISLQKEQLTEKQKEIVDSINYAKKIQTALLASEEMLLENSVNHFILFKPKDIVSGDFTWACKKDNLFYIACCDSTGHGVPGAFMSLLNIGFLSEAIKERNILKPGEIFNYVRGRLIEIIGKDEQQDGFDGTIICIDLKSNVITYSSANNSPLLIRNKELIQLSCNKMPVGKGVKNDHFDTFTLNYQKNDSLYLFTDGYPDQFGGPKGKKFKYKQLEELLLQNETLSLELQKEKLTAAFENWQGNLEQVDDVCIIGIKI